ncbi:ATP synthase subunit I [Proteinivorax hydrogeniformans]|uniref:ATP synthase subunit I n=1 Tax=Proteinivorax hydrogeniformans TaxID=1826727 RepID=A0AAU8HTM4_9FIRM
MLPLLAKKTFQKNAFITFMVMSVVAVLMALQGEFHVVYGIFLGGIMAIVNFGILSISVTILLEREGPQKFWWVIHSLIRSLLTIGILFLSFTNDGISFFATAIGLLSVKYVILLTGIYQSFKQKVIKWIDGNRKV